MPDDDDEVTVDQEPDAEVVLSQKEQAEVDAIKDEQDVIDEDPIYTLPAIVEVLSEDPKPNPSQRRRKVVRRETRPLTAEERRLVDDQIVEANSELRRFETEKAVMAKDFNGKIATERQALDDAIDILGKDSIESDEVRMEVFNYETELVKYFTEDGKEQVDERDMTLEEKQTKMDM